MALSTEALNWAEKRGISRSTLETLGVASGIKAMGRSPEPCIAFPYRRGKEVINVKYRGLEDKRFCQKDGGELRFWNLDAVLAALESKRSDTVYIVEGEMDVCAMVEAGIPAYQVVSVPNGAPQQASEDPVQTDRYAFVLRALAEGLGTVRRVVLCLDADDPGRALRSDLVSLFGPARCWFVDWPSAPKPIKDSNDFLMAHGAYDLGIYLIDGAKEWPCSGVYRMDEMPEPPDLTLWNPGFPEWGSQILLAPTMLSVATGHPGHGKTLIWSQIWQQVAAEYNVRVAVASFETRVKPHHRRSLRQFLFSKPEFKMSDYEKKKADDWIQDHYLWLSPEERPTMKWLLDSIEIAAVRYNAKVIQVDPWNKLEGDKPDGMAETDYIGRCLDSLMNIARGLNIHIQVLAHPSKMGTQRAGHIPMLEDISGSKNWDNRVDQGFCIHRPKFENADGNRNTECVFMHLKSRYEELGYQGKKLLRYDLDKCRYIHIDALEKGKE